jgi:hypothetical protein
MVHQIVDVKEFQKLFGCPIVYVHHCTFSLSNIIIYKRLDLDIVLKKYWMQSISLCKFIRSFIFAIYVYIHSHIWLWLLCGHNISQRVWKHWISCIWTNRLLNCCSYKIVLYLFMKCSPMTSSVVYVRAGMIDHPLAVIVSVCSLSRLQAWKEKGFQST